MLSHTYEAKKINYFAEENTSKFFFTEELYEAVESLRFALAENINIAIYSDACIKGNGLPTGISCSSRTSDAMLLPSVLRDPGCGFLVFKISTKQLASTWQEKIGTLLNNLESLKIFKTIKENILNDYGIENILRQGLSILDLQDENRFRHCKFSAIANLDISKNELALLKDDFMRLTNTIEIRKIIDIQDPEILKNHNIMDTDYIGFIHTGSNYFPKLLGDRFIYKICEYAHKNKLFNLKDIEKGIVGVPLECSVGKEYENWLTAAMNFSLVSRYGLFKLFKKICETTFCCEVTIIDDNSHAGIFSNQDRTYITRGVQHITTDRLSLLAGQRESAAAIIIGASDAVKYDNLIGHGTGYVINEDFVYTNNFSKEIVERQLNFAYNTFYNSKPRFAECIPYYFNLKKSLEFYEKIRLAKTIGYLSPFINIQCAKLKNQD